MTAEKIIQKGSKLKDMATLGENFSRDKINNSDLPPLGQIKVKGDTRDSKNGL
jgi:hypothetical protein